jgi:hypothetical protein
MICPVLSKVIRSGKKSIPDSHLHDSSLLPRGWIHHHGCPRGVDDDDDDLVDGGGGITVGDRACCPALSRKRRAVRGVSRTK